MGNKSLKAYQIVIKGNEVSEEYARISRESFQPAIDAGILEEIITFDAVTPESEDFEEHLSRYNWKPSIMLADLQSGKRMQDHSPTEKAGMCSHWELMRMQSESEERFLVLEHDTFLLKEHLDIFGKLIEKIKNDNILYANIGLFMGCYSLRQDTAKWQYEILTEGKFPINCGPYCTLMRLFATYTTDYLKKVNYMEIDPTVIHPWHSCDTLFFGRNVQIPFNKRDLDKEGNVWKNPTTQVISKRLDVTQDHHGYIDEYIEKPWTRHKYFHVID
jgi:hypothetical protein